MGPGWSGAGGVVEVGVGGSHWELAQDGQRGESKTLRHCVPVP